VWRPVVAKLGIAVTRNFEFAFKVVNPAADERGSIRRKIRFENFNFIQFLPRGKDK
jgi:hypothetical protein